MSDQLSQLRASHAEQLQHLQAAATEEKAAATADLVAQLAAVCARTLADLVLTESSLGAGVVPRLLGSDRLSLLAQERKKSEELERQVESLRGRRTTQARAPTSLACRIVSLEISSDMCGVAWCAVVGGPQDAGHARPDARGTGLAR